MDNVTRIISLQSMLDGKSTKTGPPCVLNRSIEKNITLSSSFIPTLLGRF